MENNPFSWETLAKYLASDCTFEEERQIEEWRNSSPINEELFRKHREVWLLAGETPVGFTVDAEEDWTKIKGATIENRSNKIKKIAPVKNLYYYLSGIAAILVIGLTLTFFLFQSGNEGFSEQSASERNTRVTLEDGTIVWLNKGSELKFPKKFEGNSREVILEGEAFFEVAHNPEKPFIIQTGNTQTRVLGTSFNINGNSSDKKIAVSVKTGKVAFSLKDNGDSKVELLPGEQGTWSSENNKLVVSKTDPNAMAWHTETLYFEKTSITNLARTLGEYYDIEVKIENEQIGNCRFTGTFEKEKLEEVLKTISFSLGIKYRTIGRKIYLEGEGC